MPVFSAGTSDPDLEKLVSEGLAAFNAAVLPSDDETPLSVRATAEDGTLIGGVTGFTWGGCGSIMSFWLSPQYRGQGLGRQLLTAAESEIRRRGCDRVVLATMSFQAPGFYLHHGYEQVGVTPGMPHGTAKHHFHKRLA
ncbi:GNAT family N-acetyltransferase [Actinoplanes sp. N902-109]|uniref:GNAT family N-acetyltransferase n=1 Tax=Actinoplanes sp. (strain N902-109) TaxID=649831 RepID=UPI0018DCAED4|nr:GNAT family N-acetyltransferase [Actinoplanes sp. N902-109]